MLRIIIEQDDQGGTPSQIQTNLASNLAQAQDGGKAPVAFGRRMMKEASSAQPSPSFSHSEEASVRDAGAAPRILQAHARHLATTPIVPQKGGIAKFSNGGTTPV
ncbi:MAG: hypothetical protein ACYDER_18345 [Ktedonobacteraceae bacterium]